jgi:hypothetical protein
MWKYFQLILGLSGFLLSPSPSPGQGNPRIYVDRFFEMKGLSPRENDFKTENQRDVRLAGWSASSTFFLKPAAASNAILPRQNQPLLVFYDSTLQGTAVPARFEVDRNTDGLFGLFDFNPGSLPAEVEGNGRWENSAVYVSDSGPLRPFPGKKPAELTADDIGPYQPPGELAGPALDDRIFFRKIAFLSRRKSGLDRTAGQARLARPQPDRDLPDGGSFEGFPGFCPELDRPGFSNFGSGLRRDFPGGNEVCLAGCLPDRAKPNNMGGRAPAVGRPRMGGDAAQFNGSEEKTSANGLLKVAGEWPRFMGFGARWNFETKDPVLTSNRV